METSFCNLKSKCVINVSNGKNLGNITDIIIDIYTGNIIAIVVPAPSKSIFNIFRSNNNIIIPYNHICKIGEDTILVDIIMQDTSATNNSISTLSNNQIENISKNTDNTTFNK